MYRSLTFRVRRWADLPAQSVWRLPDDGAVSDNAEAPRASSIQVAAIGALVFGVLFLLHHVMQGSGPTGSSAAEVAAYNVSHRGALLGSEVALGLGLLAFIAFLA